MRARVEYNYGEFDIVKKINVFIVNIKNFSNYAARK